MLTEVLFLQLVVHQLYETKLNLACHQTTGFANVYKGEWKDPSTGDVVRVGVIIMLARYIVHGGMLRLRSKEYTAIIPILSSWNKTNG